MHPLEARLKESTEQWVRSREARERRRLELEDEQCTFVPSLAGISGSSKIARRSSSADPRTRASASRGGGGGSGGLAAAAGTPPVGMSGSPAFEARSKAFQDAREQRLTKLREEKMKRELQEATFQPVIGFGGGSGGGGRRSSAGGHVGGVSAPADAGVDAMTSGIVPTADMDVAEKKEGRSMEQDESVSFKVIGFCSR